MSWIEAIILGIVQGLTEFLPVSSSGHLAIGKALFGIETADLGFEVAVHAATVLATIVVFWKDIVGLLQGLFKFRMNSETRYILLILISVMTPHGGLYGFSAAVLIANCIRIGAVLVLGLVKAES